MVLLHMSAQKTGELMMLDTTQMFLMEKSTSCATGYKGQAGSISASGADKKVNTNRCLHI